MTVGALSIATDPDPGLFGPDSVTWRLHADPVLWAGGLRALLLQALHPLAMAGVAQHSDFRSDPWGRLMRTADYVGTVTYGTTPQARAAGRRVRAVHRSVRGVDAFTGLPYRADDPALLAWIHCCEVDSFLSTMRRAGLSLTAAEADAYVAEQTRLGPLVGLPADELPADTATLADYFRRVRGQLAAGPDAREAALFLLDPPMPARFVPLRPAWVAVAGLSFGLLPRWARRMYRLPGLPTTDVAATVALRALRTGLAALPQQWREGPHRRAARERLGR